MSELLSCLWWFNNGLIFSIKAGLSSSHAACKKHVSELKEIAYLCDTHTNKHAHIQTQFSSSPLCDWKWFYIFIMITNSVFKLQKKCARRCCGMAALADISIYWYSWWKKLKEKSSILDAETSMHKVKATNTFQPSRFTAGHIDSAAGCWDIYYFVFKILHKREYTVN